jgi:Beta-lactamase
MYCLGGLLFVSVGLLAQSKKVQLANIMQTHHRYNMFDGAVLVAENGKLLYKGAFGMANREWNIPNTTDTKFMIGSVSKLVQQSLQLDLCKRPNAPVCYITQLIPWSI